MPQLILNNLRLGQRADGGTREDALLGLRRLVNYDLVYGGETVDLQVRAGYERWNSIALPELATQVRVFIDQQRNKHMLVISDDKWYDAKENAAHVWISNFAATPPRPYAQWGNRAFLGTDGTDDDDPGILWTSNAALATANRGLRLGIKRPSEPPSLEAHDKEGHIATPTDPGIMNTDTRKRLAIEYMPSINQSVRDVYISVRRAQVKQTISGAWQLKIYTDNGGKASTTLASEDAISEWIEVSTFNYLPWDHELFRLRDVIQLAAGTRYFLVLEGNTAYYDNYRNNLQPTDFYGAIGLEGLVGVQKYGPAQSYNSITDTWNDFLREGVFYLGGMEGSGASDGTAYEYVYTYYNSTHQSESRPSEGSRVKPKADQGFWLKGYVSPTDPQVDMIRFYRRELDNIDVGNDSITDTYKFVAEFIPGYYTTDPIATDQLGAVLQTMDHYCLDDFSDEEEEGLRTAALLPSCMCMWKGRLWIGENDNNRLAYSKVFEENGKTGMLGLSSPDYFPLDNVMEVPEPAYPINLYPVSNDMLLVQMSNDKTYVIYGGDQALNPPADFTIRPLIHSNSGFGVWCGTLWGHFLAYLSRAGIYMVSGFGSMRPDYISEENQSILDTVNNANLDSSIMLAVGNEMWTLIDFDNDGALDTILIVDMQRDVPTQKLYDRPWKMYQYDVTLNDIFASTGADDFQQVYAADAENKYILELRKGTLDNGSAISAWYESHDLVAPNQSMIHQLDIDAYYPDITAVPTYTWLLTSHSGRTQSGTMVSTSSSPNEDVRGHRTGVRLKDAISVRAKITQVSTKADRIRGIYISHNGE
jgi:hypothetical protein